jgi:hypothetical protein
VFNRDWRKWRLRTRRHANEPAKPLARSALRQEMTIRLFADASSVSIEDAPPDSDSVEHMQQLRVLLRTGARLHSQFARQIDACSLAMLNSAGNVVSWYDESAHSTSHDEGVLNHHVSQFYLPADLALHLPARSLQIASQHGSDTQEGWRRRPNGAIYWGRTVIEAVLSLDGQLLGFTHVTRSSRGPWEFSSIAVRRPQRQRVHWHMPVPAFARRAQSCPVMQ